jgi:hypothetical protein
MATYYATTTTNFGMLGLSILAIETTRQAAEKTGAAKIARRYGEQNIFADAAAKNLRVRSKTELRGVVGRVKLAHMLIRYSEESADERAIERAAEPQRVWMPR